MTEIERENKEMRELLAQHKKIFKWIVENPNCHPANVHSQIRIELTNLVTWERCKKPSEWEKLTEITILDPDGWREDNKSFEEPIEEEEFMRRMWNSTVTIPSHIMKKLMKGTSNRC